jgi:hypothetical protein
MNKHELLKSIGFSEEYIEHLRRIEKSDRYIFENPVIEYSRNSFDMTSITVKESVTSFSTKIESIERTAPTTASSRRRR